MAKWRSKKMAELDAKLKEERARNTRVKKKLSDFGEMYKSVFDLRKADKMADVIFNEWDGKVGLKEPPVLRAAYELDWIRYAEREADWEGIFHMEPWIGRLADAYTRDREDARLSQLDEEVLEEAHIALPDGGFFGRRPKDREHLLDALIPDWNPGAKRGDPGKLRAESAASAIGFR